MTTIRILLVLSVIFGLETKQVDFTCAFLLSKQVRSDDKYDEYKYNKRVRLESSTGTVIKERNFPVLKLSILVLTITELRQLWVQQHTHNNPPTIRHSESIR